MAGLSLIALLDDIASVLDDVALMTKVAAKKTAGVLGDDLALNAQQVSGVSADRELPVVWKVAKGSFKNKAILVPAALLISAIAPWLITPLLLIGGLFLCFEGAEKLHHAKSTSDTEGNNDDEFAGLTIEEFEDKKVKGAIRTDFILSAEIIVIALGTVQIQSLTTQLTVVSLIALLMTVGVYGLVAVIVKMDDVGLHLVNNSKAKTIKHYLGSGLLTFAPKLMRSLAIIGTIAMFLVGGSIVLHSIPGSHNLGDALLTTLPEAFAHNTIVVGVTPVLLNGLVGLLAGFIVLMFVTGIQKLRS